MPGIREQRDRVGREPANDLRHDEREIERSRHREGSTEIRRTVRVIVVVVLIVNARHAPLMRQDGGVTQSHVQRKSLKFGAFNRKSHPAKSAGQTYFLADPERRRNSRSCSVSRCLQRSSPDFWCSSALPSRRPIACIYPTPSYWRLLER